MSDQSPDQPEGQPAIRTVAMPADTNANGDIFGGWLLAQMDLAGGLTAIRRARGPVATVAIEAMKFIRPVSVGDEVSLYATVRRVGRTSLHVGVEAWRRHRDADVRERVTEATFVFVAIGADKRPREVPPE